VKKPKHEGKKTAIRAVQVKAERKAHKTKGARLMEAME